MTADFRELSLKFFECRTPIWMLDCCKAELIHEAKIRLARLRHSVHQAAGNAAHTAALAIAHAGQRHVGYTSRRGAAFDPSEKGKTMTISG